MPFDDDPEEEPEAPERLLPPDDRLWRHPTELGDPQVADQRARPSPPRRLAGRTALAGACLAGAVVAFGAMWIARPTKVIEEERARPSLRSAVTTQTASFGASVPTHRLARDLAGSVALVRVERDGRWSNATGLWVDERGTVAVPATMVDGASTVTVTGQDRVAQPARVAGTDPVTGVTALATGRTAGTPAQVAPRAAATGDLAAVIGASATDAGEPNEAPTVSVVVVRSVDMRASVGEQVLHDAVEIDRAVPPDAHGGALVDPDGRLLGMVAGNTVERDLGAVAPGAAVMAAATDLRADGKVRRAVLGVRAVDLDPARATALGVDGGARLTQITKGSPAESAGLHADDVIVSVDDQPVSDASDLVNDLARHQPGDTASIALQRGSEDHQVDVRLGG